MRLRNRPEVERSKPAPPSGRRPRALLAGVVERVLGLELPVTRDRRTRRAARTPVRAGRPCPSRWPSDVETVALTSGAGSPHSSSQNSRRRGLAWSTGSAGRPTASAGRDLWHPAPPWPRRGVPRTASRNSGRPAAQHVQGGPPPSSSRLVRARSNAVRTGSRHPDAGELSDVVGIERGPKGAHDPGPRRRRRLWRQAQRHGQQIAARSARRVRSRRRRARPPSRPAHHRAARSPAASRARCSGDRDRSRSRRGHRGTANATEGLQPQRHPDAEQAERRRGRAGDRGPPGRVAIAVRRSARRHGLTGTAPDLWTEAGPAYPCGHAASACSCRPAGRVRTETRRKPVRRRCQWISWERNSDRSASGPR